MALNLNNKSRNIQPLWLPVAILGGFLMLALLIQLIMSVASYTQIQPVHRHVNHLEQLQKALSDVENTLVRQLPEGHKLAPETQKSLQRSLQNLLNQDAHLALNTPQSIRQAGRLLETQSDHPHEMLLQVLQLLRQVFQEEAAEHKKLTQTIYQSARFEIELGVITLIILPLGALTLILLMRRRIITPLKQMSYLMKLLGQRQYQRVPEEKIDPMFLPLVKNYNHMVVRLSELEHEHLQYESRLEQQVEQAARTLIEQQRNLANSERLAALGEMMARLAHEIRNPLAGVKMACANILSERSINEDIQQRVKMVGDEIDRIVRLVNDLLEQGRHNPEPVKEININASIQDLLNLARYLIPPHIQLQSDATPEVVCRLPETGLRQALLNLIINAQQAMADQPGTIYLNAQLKDNNLLISVCDQGPGFSQEFLYNGIQTFKSQRQGGTGLGLSMVKRFARNLEGELILENSKPHGACVTLKLPCKRNTL